MGGGICYDLVNAYACFCPDRIFRPQCNTTAVSPSVPSSSVLMSSSGRKSFRIFKKKQDQSELFFADKIPSGNGDKSLNSNCLCRNGGLCFTNPMNGKLCQCLNGFTGSLCEISICKFISINRYVILKNDYSYW